MGNRALVERRLKSRVASLVAVSLAMLLATAVPVLAAQAPGDGVPGEPGPAGQPEPAQVLPAEPLAKPLAEPPLEPSVGVPGNCSHAAGEFLVGYLSEEALRAAPQENVVETFDGILAQHLVFEDIKNIADPAGRLAAEEAKRQELAAQPGVAYAEYNCIAEANQAAAADEGASIPLPKSAPASCGDCGRSVVEGARRIIADGFQGAGSKGAFDAALQAARNADEENLAFASELDEEGSAEDRSTGDAGSSDAGSTDSDNETDGDDSSGSGSSGDATSEEDSENGEEDTGSDADAADSSDANSSDANSSDDKAGSEEESGSGERAGNVESGDEDDAAGGEGEDTGAAGASDAGPVSGKNAAVSEGPGVVSGPRVLVLGAGGLLLAAGVFVGRRILRV